MTFLLAVHVLAAIFIIGPLTFATSMTPRVIRQGRDGLGTLRLLARTTRIYTIASLLVFLLGVGLVRHSAGFSFNQFWVSASMTLYVVAVGLLAIVVGRDQTKAIATLSGSSTDTPSAAINAGRINAAAGAAALMWLAVVFLMVYKPGAAHH